jgi:hypothetical protein
MNMLYISGSNMDEKLGLLFLPVTGYTLRAEEGY